MSTTKNILAAARFFARPISCMVPHDALDLSIKLFEDEQRTEEASATADVDEGIRPVHLAAAVVIALFAFLFSVQFGFNLSRADAEAAIVASVVRVI